MLKNLFAYIVIYQTQIIKKGKMRAMKLWVVMNPSGKFLARDNSLSTFAFAKVFRNKAQADERINRLESKKKYPLGELYSVQKELQLTNVCSYNDLVKGTSHPDIEFINSCKMLVSCKYGYVDRSRSNYSIPEKRFSKQMSKAALFNNVPELIVGMQLRMAFLDIMRETLINVWTKNGSFKDEIAAEKEIEDLLELYKGKNMEVQFYQ